MEKMKKAWNNLRPLWHIALLLAFMVSFTGVSDYYYRNSQKVEAAEKQENMPTFPLQPPEIRVLSDWKEMTITRFSPYRTHSRYIAVDGKKAIESYSVRQEDLDLAYSLAFVPE